MDCCFQRFFSSKWNARIWHNQIPNEKVSFLFVSFSDLFLSSTYLPIILTDKKGTWWGWLDYSDSDRGTKGELIKVTFKKQATFSFYMFISKIQIYFLFFKINYPFSTFQFQICFFIQEIFFTFQIFTNFSHKNCIKIKEWKL